MNIEAGWIANSYRNHICLIGERRRSERPIEYSFLFDAVAELDPKSVVDIGSGQTRIPLDVALCGIDVTATDCSPQGWQNRNWPVVFDDITHTRLIKSYNMVSCISVLEHIEESLKAIDGMLRVAASGGFIVLTFPYNETTYVPNVCECDGARYEGGGYTKIFSRDYLNAWFADRAVIVKQDYWQVFDSELWRCGNWIQPKQVTVDELHHLTCLLLRKVI